MTQEFAPFPIIGLSPKASSTEEGSGVVAGTGIDASEETKKRIWALAEERQIENTRANRLLAYSLDGLTRFIVNIKRFSILKDYALTSNDDTKNEALLAEIETFLTDTKLMHVFRQLFTHLQIEGTGHLQKDYDGKTLTSLAVLECVQKYVNPVDVTDFYYYQSSKVSKNWQNPEEEELKPLKVWFIDPERRDEYTAIKEPEDKVYGRDRIIEIENNESGESNLQSIVSHIFIKNFLLQMLPNLIEVVTSPNEQIIYDTIDKNGQQCVPRPPPEELKTADINKYNAQTKTYAAWKAGLTELANRISLDRTKMRKTIHPDSIHEEILESKNAINSDMIKALVHVLDVEISYGMGFSLSLIEASGVELASAHTIFATVATTMRGTQQMFNEIAEVLIYERFPQAEVEGIVFELNELNPEDELSVAQRKKVNAETVEIMAGIGIDVDSLNIFVNRNVDETLTFSDTLEQPIDEAAEEVVEAMLSYRDSKAENVEEE